MQKIDIKSKNVTNTVGATSGRPNSNGITLVALVITIIVMLLLIGVTVSTVLKGDLFNIAKKASVETRASMVEEKVAEWKANKKIDEYLEENSNTQSLEELLNDLETQQLITNEERKEIEENMQVKIGDKGILFYEFPEGYTKLEYLESTGTQYIDTGVPCNSITAMETTVSISLISKQIYPFGADGSGYTRFSISYCLENGKVCPEFRIGYYYYVSNTFDYNDKITIKLNAYDGTYYLNESLVGISQYSLKKGNLKLTSHTIGVFKKHNNNMDDGWSEWVPEENSRKNKML